MKYRGFANYIPVIIMLVVFILVALFLGPTIANQSAALQGNANVTVAGQNIVPLIPLLYVLLPVAALVGAVVAFFGAKK